MDGLGTWPRRKHPFLLADHFRELAINCASERLAGGDRWVVRRDRPRPVAITTRYRWIATNSWSIDPQSGARNQLQRVGGGRGCCSGELSKCSPLARTTLASSTARVDNELPMTDTAWASVMQRNAAGHPRAVSENQSHKMGWRSAVGRVGPHPTHCCPWPISRRTTGLLRNLTFDHAAEKASDGESGRSRGGPHRPAKDSG